MSWKGTHRSTDHFGSPYKPRCALPLFKLRKWYGVSGILRSSSSSVALPVLALFINAAVLRVSVGGQ